MVWPDRCSNPRSTALEASSLTITPLMGWWWPSMFKLSFRSWFVLYFLYYNYDSLNTFSLVFICIYFLFWFFVFFASYRSSLCLYVFYDWIENCSDNAVFFIFCYCLIFKMQIDILPSKLSFSWNKINWFNRNEIRDRNIGRG